MENTKEMYCHFCGAVRENPQAPKCARCGTLFVKTCSRCGAPVKKDRETCIKCGLAIDKMVAPMPGMRIVSESEQINYVPPKKESVINGLKKKKLSLSAIGLTILIILVSIFTFNFVLNHFHLTVKSNIKIADYKRAMELADTAEEKLEVIAMNSASLAIKKAIKDEYKDNDVSVDDAWVLYPVSWGDCVAVVLQLSEDTLGSGNEYVFYQLRFSDALMDVAKGEIPDREWVMCTHNRSGTGTYFEYFNFVDSYQLSNEQIAILNELIRDNKLKKGKYIKDRQYFDWLSANYREIYNY